MIAIFAISNPYFVYAGSTPPSFGSIGSAAGGSTSISVAHPSGISAGDLLVLAISNKYPTNGPTTPSGWTALPNYQGSGGSGSPGADTGTVYATVFVKIADGTESGNLAVTLTSANSSIGQMLRYTKDPASVWSYAAVNGSDNSGGTDWSVTADSNLYVEPGDVVIAVSGINADPYSYSGQAMSLTGVSWTGETERAESSVFTGDDAEVVISEHVVSSGATFGQPTFTMTSSGSATDAPAGATVFLRIRQVPPAKLYIIGGTLKIIGGTLKITN